MKRAILLSCFAALAAGQQGNSSSSRNGENWNMTADSIRSGGGSTHLSGHVVFETDAIVLQADAADYNEGSHEIQAYGSVNVKLK